MKPRKVVRHGRGCDCPACLAAPRWWQPLAARLKLRRAVPRGVAGVLARRLADVAGPLGRLAVATRARTDGGRGALGGRDALRGAIGGGRPERSTSAACLVLVVEDEAEVRWLVRTVLEDAGFVVLEAADGPAGLELARRYRPCAIVVDLRPPSVDGAALTRACRADPEAPAPVVVLAAEPDAARHARRLGATVVSKPFELGELVRAVDGAAACRHAAA
jgi:CheY-like chemotaxis protein